MSKQHVFGQAVGTTDQWATPQDFFNKLNEVFNFTLDVCASRDNAKCERYFTPEQNGLAQEWSGVCWMNPPYSREIIQWIAKAADTAKKGHTVVALVPVRTDARWWQDYCLGREIHFVRGRLKFGDAANSAPFGSAVIVFRPCLDDVFREKLAV